MTYNRCIYAHALHVAECQALHYRSLWHTTNVGQTNFVTFFGALCSHCKQLQVNFGEVSNTETETEKSCWRGWHVHCVHVD